MTGRRSAAALLPRALHPLARRVTAVMTILLCSVIGSMLWLAHERVNNAVVGTELARLQASSNQLATTLHASARRLIQESSRLAASSTLKRVVSPNADASEREAARRFLTDERARSQQILAIAVWDASGRMVMAEGPPEIARRNAPKPTVRVEGAAPASAAIGPLSATGDTVSYAIVSPIDALNGATVGSVVVTRRVASGSESAALLGGLVGRGAQVMLGNADESFWSDLAKPVAGPTVPPAPGTGGDYRDSAGVDHLGASAAVMETPWVVLVDIPRHAAVAAASKFAVEMLLIAALFIFVGALISWYFIRRTMRPLEDVTHAAEGVALGDYSRRVAATGFDEISLLGKTFNVMAEKVAHAAREIASRAHALEIANEDLQESEHKYRGLFEHLPDGILVHRDKRIVFANPTSTRLLGAADPRDLVGRSVLDCVVPADREMVASRIDTMDRGGLSAPPMEVRLKRDDRKSLVVEATSMPLTLDGVPAVQTIMHDVTERRLLEEQLRQSQKMDAVGRLAGGVAHDFNNLLTVIQAHAEFALDETASDTARRADIEEIRRATESAARLTRQLLTFSRKQVLSPTHIDLNDAIAGMVGMVKRLIGDDIEVMIVAATDLAGIWADPGQIQQVLLNLAVNSRDAMPNGGMLRFETANVVIGEGYLGASASVIPPGPYVMLAVQDTGVGMTEEVRTRVFEPFFTTKPSGRGTGLGLSTVYGIVLQSHGHIWVYSEPERGTTFKVFFPPHRVESGESEVVVTEEHHLLGAGAHLLVVEDEPSVRAAVCRALTNAGFTVTEAKHAAEAREILARDPSVNLMITDMVMPGKSGVALVAELRSTHAHLPVIILSGYSEETASQDWRVPDHAVFLEKPVSPAELIRRVRQLLGAAS